MPGIADIVFNVEVGPMYAVLVSTFCWERVRPLSPCAITYDPRRPKFSHDLFVPANPHRLRMDYWGSFPDELIIRVFLSLIDDPRPILSFAQTSKRHNAIATDDAVWLPIAVYTFKWFGVPGMHVDENLLRQHRNRILTQVQSHQTVYHQLYVRLIGPYKWLLGWWIAHGRAPPRLWRAYLRFDHQLPGEDTCSIVGHPIIASFDTYKAPEELHSAVQYTCSVKHPDGFYVVTLENHPTITGYGHNPVRITYPHSAVRQPESWYQITPVKNTDELPISKQSHHGWQRNIPFNFILTPPIDISPWIQVHRKLLSGRLLDRHTQYDDAPFPSPSTVPVVPGVRFDVSNGSPIVPRAMWYWRSAKGRMRSDLSATPIHSPSYYPSETNNILATGIYGTQGTNKPKFIFLNNRSLTTEDFIESWPWEGHFGSSLRGEEQLENPEVSLDWSDPDVHLGPFSAVRCTIMEVRSSRLTSEDHVRPGARIVEMVKLAGGGAPSGQRSIVAFLQDPRVPSHQLAEMEAHSPMSHRDSLESGSPPWPISRAAMAHPTSPATKTSILQIPFEPERGIDLPAVGRFARAGFIQPSWLDVIVHVESRDQFTILWRDHNVFEVYTKMNDI